MKTLARWLLVVLLTLFGLLLVFFIVVGVENTFPGTPVSAVREVGGPVSITDSTYRGMVESTIKTPLLDGNAVELLLNGEQTYPRLWRDLRAARRSIAFQVYYAEPGALADTLKAVLSERARAGVRVLFLYDAVGSTLKEEYVRELQRAGVRAQPFRPMHWYSLAGLQHRSHVRAVVIDGTVGYTGGFGIADKWLGGGHDPEHWRDTNIRFTGPAVAQLQAAFAIGWAEASQILLAGPLFFPREAYRPTGAVAAGLLHGTPSIGSTQAERFLALSIAGARRSLYITNSYFVPDDDLRRLLIQAARRGVDVRILTAGTRTDVKSVLMAGRDRYEQLLRGGVRIYEYQPAMIHAKTLVVDGLWSTVGSMNFDNRSTALNEESNLVVLDPALGARMNAVFFDDLRFAKEIRLPEFRRRPWYDRVLEKGATLMTRVL